jgi:hypothetical protein
MTSASTDEAPAAAPRAAPGFLLRTAAIWAALTMPVVRIMAPGVRGNASDAVVVGWQLLAATASYALALLLSAIAIEGSAHLLRRDHPIRGLRAVVLSGTLVTMALVAPAFLRRLPSQPAIVLTLAACIVVLVATSRALAAAETRAVALVLALFGLAALVRLFAWQLAVAAGDQLSDRLYGASRVVASAGVVLEAGGQLAAVAWLGTRGRVSGQVLTVLAVGTGFFLTWGATLGVHHDAARWQAILHTALLEAQGIPAPLALSAVATFLLAASYPLAFVAMLQRRGDARMGSVLVLALIAHGAFDAPLRALAAVAAGIALVSTNVFVARRS